MIKENMKFFNFNDFYNHCEYIRREYKKLSWEEKEIYKYYVYSNRLIKDKIIDKVWEYLNEPFGSVYYVTKQKLRIYLIGDGKFE